ncbi:MFS transporter [Sphaerochaeta sp. PS]|uniref:MFS transporter n=1 Tax=Sphaerochaeta sp. PS TaxID=3076336 RepID=UPI0028A37FEF|nr:MFS transporter [Sphaerochaeta sp. PS]MDT4762323.1 MFS transporter [Sphaerochaeta sp. PS]
MLQLYISFFFLYSIFAVINPFLQVLLRNSGYSYEAVGILLAIFEIAGIVGPLVVGRIVGKTGRLKDTILVSTAAASLGLILLVRSGPVWLTIVALAISAFFLRSLLPLLDTVATNRFNGDAQKYSYIRSFGTLGFVVFSLAFAALGIPVVSDNSSIIRYALMGCLLFFLPVLSWKEVPQPKKSKEPVKRVPFSVDPWFDSAFVIGLVIIALNRLSMSAISSFLSLYLVEELHIDAISLINALAAGAELLFMVFAGYLIQKKKVLPVFLLLISGLGMVLRLLIYAHFPSLAGVVVGQLLHSVGFGFFHPAAIQLVARRVKRSHRALGMSMYISLGTGLPSVLGATLGGILTEGFGYKVMFESFSVFSMLSVLLCLVFWKKMRTPAIEEV